MAASGLQSNHVIHGGIRHSKLELNSSDKVDTQSYKAPSGF